MGANGTERTGGELIVDTLSANGATLAFGVPGESFLAVLDGFYGSNQMEFVISRQEGGAAMMADAYGKLTGRPGICFVTRGPGATNASSGVHIAYQDSSPMILFIGQVGRSMLDREAFQEIDYRRMFGQMSKWTAEISDATRIPEYINRAFHVATSGRPGPVVLALPEDMLRDRVAKPEVVPASAVTITPGTDDARADFEAWSKPTLGAGDVQLSQIVAWLRENTPDDTIICNGAGNYTSWVHRFYRYRRHGTQLAPTSGSMGYGTPAAVAAKLVHPDRTVISFAGDGCFMMNDQEIATAAQYGANIIVIVANNRMLGTIRMHQERAYPGRVVGTDLINPDFAALAQAYGAHGEKVTRTEDFADAFERASNAGRPAMIELEIDPEALTPGAGLSAIREAAQNA